MPIKPNPPAVRPGARSSRAARAAAEPQKEAAKPVERMPTSFVDEHPGAGAKQQFLAKRDSWARVVSGLRAPAKGAGAPAARRPALMAFLEDEGPSER